MTISPGWGAPLSLTSTVRRCERSVACQGLARLGTGDGEADDRLALEELPQQIAEVRGVNEGPRVLEIAGRADIGGLAERLRLVHASQGNDEPVREQPGEHRGDAALLHAQLGRRACGELAEADALVWVIQALLHGTGR
jgi:hypothetical protein